MSSESHGKSRLTLGSWTNWLLIVVFSLMLTACGGGSSSGSTVAPEDEQGMNDGEGDLQDDDDEEGDSQEGSDSQEGEEGDSQEGDDSQNGEEDDSQEGDDSQNGEEDDPQEGDDSQEGEEGDDSEEQGNSGDGQEQSVSVEAPDGTIIRLVGISEVSAQEGSIVTLSATLENADNDAITSTRFSWQRVGDEEFNTPLSAGTIDPQTYAVTLPLVDAEAILNYEVSVEIFLEENAGQNTVIEMASLSIPFSITILDTLPSEGHVVLADGRPAPGIEGASIDSIDLYGYSRDGKVAIAGSYRDADNAQGHAIWAGSPDDIQLLVKTGDAISGLPANATFDRADSVNIASGGEIAAIAQLQGSGTSRAALISVDGVVQSILRTSDAFPTSIMPEQVLAISSVVRTSNSAFVFAGNGDSDEGGLWEWTPDGYSLVALTLQAMASVIPAEEADSSTLVTLGIPVSDDGCPIAIAGNYVVNDNGKAVFPSGTGVVPAFNQTTFQSEFVPTDCARGLAIRAGLAQYEAGDTSELIGTGSFDFPNFGTLSNFPGISTAGFYVESLRYVYDDGSVLFDAEVLEDVGSAVGLPQTADAILKSTPDGRGDFSLIAMESETLPPSFIQRFEGSNDIYLSRPAGDQLAIMVSGADGVSLFAGSGHETQPYTTLSAIGASPLRYVSGESASAPVDYPTTAFFSEFSLPVVESSGAVRFQATLRDSVDDSLLVNGIWISTADGTTSLRSSEVAAVQSGGRQIWLTNTDVRLYDFAPSINSFIQGSSLLVNDSEGGLIFTGDLADTLYGTNANALVYLPAARP